MNIRKSIAYAYATSNHSKTLGVYRTGGYFIEQSILLENATWSPGFIAPGTEGDVFQSPTDPDMISLYNETDGEPCPYFLRYKANLHSLEMA